MKRPSKLRVALLACTLFGSGAIQTAAETVTTAQDSISVSTSGDVGIGTTAPDATLHVLKSGTAFDFYNDASFTTAIGLQNTANPTSSVGIALVSNPGGNNQINFGDTDTQFAGRILYDNSVTPNTMDFRVSSDTGPGVVRMLLDGKGQLRLISGGSLFNFYEDSLFKTGLGIQNTAASNHGIGLALVSGNASNVQINFGDTDDQFVGRIVYDHATNVMDFQVDQSVRMSLDGNGDLDVTGDISSGGTTLNVPDYVFEPGYELRPIAELEAFITENRHLPNVPSGAEIAESGLNHGEFQMKLLEKIEELTLYIVSQQRELDAKEARVLELEQRMTRFETLLAQRLAPEPSDRQADD